MKKRRCINPDTVVMLKQIAIGVLVLTTVALLVTATWYGTRVKFLTIQEVMVEGGQTISTVEIEKKVQAALEGQYLRLVPRRFAWLYPEAEVLEIVKSVERVHDVKTEVIKGIKLSVTFDEYIPLSLWCDSVVSYNCLFIDEKGYAFGRAPKLSGGTFLRFVSTDRNIEIGQTLSGQEIFDNSLRMAALLKDESWFVSHIELDKVGDVFLVW